MFHSMHYVYEVYKERSFSKAAANLYISQPSLSAAVKKVEEKIGAPIFDRSVSPIQLTECGEQYIRSAEEIMGIQERFENYLNDLNELKTGQLSIGGSNLFATYILPPMIAQFTQKYPLVKIHLTEADTPQLMELLFQGSLDLVIDNCQFPEAVYHPHFLADETLLLAVPKSFSSNQKTAAFQLTQKDIQRGQHLDSAFPYVSLQEFRQEPFIFLRSGNDTRSRAEKICQMEGVSPNVILKLDQQVTAFNICRYGMGITFVGDTLIRHIPNVDECCFYKLDNPQTKRSIFFYHKQTKYMTRAMAEFLRIAGQD